MEEELKKIRASLDKIERDDREDKMQFRQADFGRFDLPKHVCDIVEYLQPLLLPNEAAIYWYLFKNSFVKNMNNEIRFYVADLCKDFEVIGSSSGRAKFLGYRAAMAAIEGLEAKKVIQRRTRDATKDGYHFTIQLPLEIQICIDRKKVMDDEKLKKGIPSIKSK